MSELDELIGDLKMTRSILETTVMENLDLKERLERTQEALKVVIAEKLKDLDGSRSKRVEAEREACALEVEGLARGLGEMINSQTTISILRGIEIRMLLLKDVAAMIRARKEQPWR